MWFCVCACNWCRPLYLEPNMCFSFCFVGCVFDFCIRVGEVCSARVEGCKRYGTANVEEFLGPEF